MYRSILVPLDGTPFGEYALPLALAAARRAGATLHLVHVHTPVLLPLGVEIPPPGASLSEPGRERAESYLERLVERIMRSAGVAVTHALVEGPVVPALEERIHLSGADLVVMSTHAPGGVSALWRQGVADRLRQSLPIPFLLVRGGTAELPDPLAEQPLRHLLVPLDGTAFSEAVLEHAGRLCRAFGAECTLLRVIHPPVELGYTLAAQGGHLNQAVLEERRREAALYLYSAALRLRLPPQRLHSQVEVAEDVPGAILAALARPADGAPPVDMLAMECHPHGRLARALGAHCAEAVLREAPVPVLLHHPAPLGEARLERPISVDA